MNPHTRARRFAFYGATALILLLAVLPLKQLAVKAKPRFPVLVRIQEYLSQKAGKPVALADVQDYLHTPVFAVFCFMLLEFLTAQKRTRPLRAALQAFVIVAAFSIATESLQSLVPKRQASAQDIFLNVRGYFLGVLAFALVSLWKSKR